MESGTGHQFPWTWSCRLFRAINTVESSARAVLPYPRTPLSSPCFLPSGCPWRLYSCPAACTQRPCRVPTETYLKLISGIISLSVTRIFFFKMIATFEPPALLSVAVHQSNVPAMTCSFAATSRGDASFCLPPRGTWKDPPVLPLDSRANHKTYLHGKM